MFRKSSKQKKQHNKRKRYTKKNNKTITGAGFPGIFKWAVSNISGDTLFDKSIYTIRKDNYEPNTVYLKNDFIRILNDLYISYKGNFSKQCDTSILVNKVFKDSIDNIFKQDVDNIITMVDNNKLEQNKITGTTRVGVKINKNHFEDILHLIKKEYDNNQEKYDNEICETKSLSNQSTDSTVSNLTTISSVSNSYIKPKVSDSYTSFCYKFKDITPRIIEPYKLGKELGQGAFGSVYEITINDKKHAAKHIKANIDDTKIQTVIDELKILQAISDKCKVPGFVVCFDGIICDNNKKKIYIIQELLDNNYVEMYDFIYKNSGQISPTNVYNIIHSLCSGLKSIHDSNVAHRDIKPENVKVNITNSTIKYLDFGLSSKVDKSGNFELGEPFDKLTGTPEYIDPLVHEFNIQTFEMIKNYDYFSLGLVIFELIVKHLKQNVRFNTDFYNTPYYCLNKQSENDNILMYKKFYSNRKFLENKKIQQVINHYNDNIKKITPKNLYSVDLIQVLNPSYEREKGIIPPQ
jgi:tRNA A-37 threonylcarbamoyl transferase component Bud32